MSSFVLSGQNNYNHCYISFHCAIEDGDEVVLTGGVLGRDFLVTRYNVEGEATSLPSLNTGRATHACGKFITADLETVSLGSWSILLLLTLPAQFYIVSGGYVGIPGRNLASTEILNKNGGTGWATAASLPFGRRHFTGLSISNGHFLVAGGDM